MSLQTRLSALITAIGADVKDLRTQIEAMSGPESIDGGTPDGVQIDTIDAGALA